MDRKEKSAPMRDGWFWRDNGTGHLVKVIQRMNDEDGQPKGMQLVLEERGLIDGRSWMKGRCGKDGHRPNSEGYCCMEVLLGSQPDFREQESNPWIKEVVESLGHKCLKKALHHQKMNH